MQNHSKTDSNPEGPSANANVFADIWSAYASQQSPETDHGLPTYIESEADISETARKLADILKADGFDLPLRGHPLLIFERTFKHNPNSTHILDRSLDMKIVEAFFNAIRKRQDELIAVFLDNRLVSTETLDELGRTPLLVAVHAGHVRTVQQLMDYDADVNSYGTANRSESHEAGSRAYAPNPDIFETCRTPLQRAAELGNLVLVKLLMETYQADDSIIAPDGELALRLAAKNGHKEVVNYLPSRRGGGWRRWKTKHAKAMNRVKKASHQVYKFFKAILYEMPKLLIWDVPKHVVVKPLVKGAKWLRVHYKELPERIWLGLKEKVWPGIKSVVKGLGTFIRKLPRRLGKLAKYFYRAILSLPRAGKLLVLWLWGGITDICKAIGSTFARLLSWLHTMFVAVINFFKNVTLKDIMNGFVSFVRSIFIDLPEAVWIWICKFGQVSFKVMSKILGGLGELCWWIGYALVFVVLYIPRRLWEIICAIAGSIGNGGKEVVIWFNPKWQSGA